MARDFAQFQADRAMQFGAYQSDLAYQRNRQSVADAQIYNSAVQASQQAFQTISNDKAMAFSQKSMDEQRAFEAQMGQTQRDWQAEMSGTAYQRMVADMRKAGLNPILGVNSGGASTPSGGIPSTTALPGTTSGGSSGGGPGPVGAPTAAGHSGTAGIPGASSAQGQRAQLQPARLLDIIGPAVANATSLYRAMNEAESIKADVDLKRANIGRTEADISLIYQELRNKGLTEDEIKERIKHIQLMQTTEASRPPLMAAQAGEAAASASHHAASAGTAKAQENKTRLETELIGRFGTTSSPLSTVGQPVQDIGNAISRDILGPVKDLYNRLFNK